MILQKPYIKMVVNISGIGDVVGVKLINIKENLAEFVSEFIQSNKKNVALFDNYIVRANDPHIHIKDVISIVLEDEVYYLLTNVNNQHGVMETIKCTCYPEHSLAILSHHVDSYDNSQKADFKYICDQALYIVAGAYDGEGYIFWERNDN